MADVHGFCDERFRPLEDAFRANLDSGVDKGASLAATLNGEFVVDLWGGTRDYEMARPWESDTIVRVFSSSKIAVMIMILMLVDRGQLDLDEPIATYWPEFAKHGKGAITTRQVLIHQSGVPGYGRVLTFDELADRATVNTIIEDAALWYEPGTVSCYHPFTFGDILGELIRRLSGTSFEHHFRTEIADPLDADFQFTRSKNEADRVAALWPAPEVPPAPESDMAAAVMAELGAESEWIDPENLPAFIPAASGTTNARAMARIGSIIALNGMVDGHRYLSSEIVAEAGHEQSYVVDEVVGWCRYGLGFGLHSDEFPAMTTSTMAWGGYGGSFLAMDPAAKFSCAFAPNQLLRDGGPGEDRRGIVFREVLRNIVPNLD